MQTYRNFMIRIRQVQANTKDSARGTNNRIHNTFGHKNIIHWLLIAMVSWNTMAQLIIAKIEKHYG